MQRVAPSSVVIQCGGTKETSPAKSDHGARDTKVSGNCTKSDPARVWPGVGVAGGQESIPYVLHCQCYRETLKSFKNA